ncbi:hypothetical protein GCM10008959_32970 [Deinococcus seoulensis]|uniref:Uncharacterized protein n=1 Tax=Deinococcus seoulensis TaxID=1837379 RepID=A0ABQ2RUL7_9DEIO|nr:hypothetical protein [Deinococcus seoulensis]GGR68286.1 hypothetical protein GCM10008959_32970 [Deinococcus seoulensis]
MPDDDLLTLLLGCGCRKRCCCSAPDPTPTQPTTPLFGQAPRTVPPPRLPDETPFIPTAPSHATGQRPSDFGVPHVPSTDPDGRPTPRTATPNRSAAVTLDTGETRPLNEAFQVDHQAREIRLAPIATDRTLRRVRADGELLTINARFWEYAIGTPSWEYDLSPTVAASRVEAVHATLEQRVLTYAGTESQQSGQLVTSTPARVVRFQWTRLATPQEPQAFRLRARRASYQDTDGSPLERIVWFIDARVTQADGTPSWETIGVRPTWAPPVNVAADTAEDAWPFQPGQILALPVEDLFEPDYTSTTSAVFDRFVFATDQPPLPELVDLSGPRWISPDGRVRIDGPASRDPALLTHLDTLITPAGTFAGPGSWAAYRGAHGGPVLLIDVGGTVTRVDLPPEGPDRVQAVPLQTFLNGLGVSEPGWSGFARTGPLYSAWPPHEALTRDAEAIET